MKIILHGFHGNNGKISYPINLGGPKNSRLFITQKLVMVHCGHVIPHMKELIEYIQNSTQLKLSWLFGYHGNQ